MKKIIILLLALMSFFSFSKNYEKKEDKKAGISSVDLILREGQNNSYDFSFDYVLLGSMPKLRQSAGTAYKKGNKYVCEDLNGDRVTFDIQKNKVVVSSSGYALSGDYSYMSESTDSDYEVIDWIMENEM